MLTINSISFSFGKKPIFQELNLEFQKGKTYGVVGANGVGKTTFFRSLAGIYTLKSGQIKLDDIPSHSSKVSFLPTSPYFYPHMKGIEYYKITQQDETKIQRCIHMANQLNIPLDHLVETYSTGMQKKLAFISQYVKDRPISIYDEPFNGVDLESNEILQQLLLKDKEGRITLVSSHILSMLFEFCDEIIHIEKGFKTTVFNPSEFSTLKKKIRANLQ
ncbi:MAG: ATP-binding cassette domain-containing protein [Bacteroidota bacterium]